jgi:hypothetical protein
MYSQQGNEDPMTITPTPAAATRSLAMLKLLRFTRNHGSSSALLLRLAATTPGWIVMGGGLVLLAVAPAGSTIAIMTILLGALLVCVGLSASLDSTIHPHTTAHTLSPGEIDSLFGRRAAGPSEIIDTASWLAADGIERSAAVAWLLELHSPTRAVMEEAVVLHTERTLRCPTDSAAPTLRLLIAATAATSSRRSDKVGPLGG